MNLITDKQITGNGGSFPSQYDTVKVVQGEKKWYQHGDETFATKSALRRALSSEYGGAWIEEKGSKKRYFIDDGLFKRSIREVSKEEFAQKLDTPSTWQKVLGLGLGILALAPGVLEWARRIPKETGLGLLALQQKSPIFGALGYSLLPSTVESQAVGTEFQVNTNIIGDQFYPSATSLNNGDFVITWQSQGQDGDSWGVYAQRYNLYGMRVGTEFLVNTNTTNGQANPTIGPLTNGGFVVAWVSNGQDGDGNGIFAQRYAQNGQPNGAEFQVNNYTAMSQTSPRLATLDDGKFVITWFSDGQDGSGTGVYAQIYDANGSLSGGELRANTYVNSRQQSQSIAALENGGFVIVWDSDGQDGSTDGIYGQRFDVNGTRLGTEFQINSYIILGQYFPSVAKNEGGFVVTWISYNQDRSDGGNGIYAQMYNANGTRAGSEFQVNTYTTGSQVLPEVAVLADGTFVIVWESQGQDGGGGGTVAAGIYAQRFNSSGFRNGTEFQVNNYTIGDQRFPFVASLNDGGFIVVWYSEGQDGNGTGIFGQRYNANGDPIPLEVPIPTQISTSRQLTASASTQTSTSWGAFSILDVVYLQEYLITRNGQTIGTFTFTGGTGQISSSNPNVLNIQFNTGYAPEEEEFIPLFSIPPGQASDWQSIQLGDTDFECLEAHAEINLSTNGGNDFGLIFTGADSCTARGSQIIAGILPIMMN